MTWTKVSEDNSRMRSCFTDQTVRSWQKSKQEDKEDRLCKKLILLVDDEEFVVSAEQEMIERYFDYKVMALTNSVKALEVFRARPDHFDLVITDMIMPKMTGEVLAKELIAVRPDIPVILCTGYSECIIKNRAEEMGGAFLIKPFDLYEMGRAIRKALYKG